MAASSLRRENLLAAAVASAAIAFLLLMVITGALPKSRQKADYQAQGVLKAAPESVSTVAIRSGERQVIFQRTPKGGWAVDGGSELDEALGKRLSLAVQFMHTSNPVRVLEAPEVGKARSTEFGLERPGLTVALLQGTQPLLAARFGALNPEGYLQYVAVEGRPQLYLLSRFVGEEWQAVAAGVQR